MTSITIRASNRTCPRGASERAACKPRAGAVHRLRQFLWMKQLPPALLSFMHNWLASSRVSGPTSAA
jgi:hypothetical protein